MWGEMYLWLNQHSELSKEMSRGKQTEAQLKDVFRNLFSVDFESSFANPAIEQQGKRRTEARTEAHPTIWCQSGDREAEDQVDVLRWNFTTHSSDSEEATGQRPELKPTHPPDRLWHWSGDREAKIKSKCQRWICTTRCSKRKVMIPFFIIFLLVWVVEDGIKVALFFHRISLQHLTVVLVNFSLQVLVICLETTWSNRVGPFCPNGLKRVTNFVTFVACDYQVKSQCLSGCHNLRLVLISKFSQHLVLETRMLCFLQHSRQKCRKSRFLEQNSCF